MEKEIITITPPSNNPPGYEVYIHHNSERTKLNGATVIEREIDYEKEVKRVWPDAYEHCYLGYWQIRVTGHMPLTTNHYSDKADSTDAWKSAYLTLKEKGI